MQRERFVPGDLNDFLEHEVFPALWHRLDVAFPEFGFQQKGNLWQATAEQTTRSLPGNPRPDRVQAYENTPFGFKIHGGEFVSWMSYLSGEDAPRGAEFIDAVRALSERAGVPFPERQASPEQVQRAQERDRRADLLEAFITDCCEALQSETGAAARAYLNSRGFSDEAITEFEFGLYANADQVLSRLTDRGFGVEEVREAALVSPAFDTGAAMINLWPGRITGPWRDRGGRIINVWARDITGNADDEKKYLMLRGGSKASPFGLHRASGKDLVLVEGFLDCLSLHAAGISSAVAVGGASLSEDQIATLASARIRSLSLNLDYDGPGGAGEEGTLRALDRLSEAPFRVYVVNPVDMVANGNVADKVDPDSYVRAHGADRYRELVDAAIRGSLFRAHIVLSRADTSTDRGRDEALEQLITCAAQAAEDRDREDIYRLASERLGYTPQTLAGAVEAHEDRQARERVRSEAARLLDTLRANIQAPEADPAEAVDHALPRLADLRRRLRREEAPEFSVDSLLDAVRQGSSGKLSGWESLDALGVRFHPAELAVLGARTGHGKTTALLSLLLNWLRQYPEERFIFCSFELPPEAVLLKLASALTAQGGGDRWTYYEIRDWLQDRERPRHYPNPASLEGAFEVLRGYEARLSVVYQTNWNVTDVSAFAYNVAQKGQPVGGILLDYLQLVRPPDGSYDRRDIEVSQVARELKSMSVALSCPVVAAAQIGRQAAQAGDRIPEGDFEDRAVQEAIRRRRPQLHYLREGGSEQEADLVLGLLNYRADYLEELGDSAFEQRGLPGPFEVLVLKNRFGSLGTATMVLDGATGHIRDRDVGEEW